jgi:hypothetical protein
VLTLSTISQKKKEPKKKITTDNFISIKWPFKSKGLADALLKHAGKLCEHVWRVDSSNMILFINQES